MRPSNLQIALNGSLLVDGTLFGTVKTDDIEWELLTVGTERQIVLQLAKSEKEKPFWTSLLTGHPEVDVRGLKRDPKELEELLAESGMGDMMQGAMAGGGMPSMEQMMAMKAARE